MLSLLRCPRCAIAHPTFPYLLSTSLTVSGKRLERSSEQSIEKLSHYSKHTAGRATFESSKTTLRVASFSPMMASLNQPLSKATSSRNQKFQTPPSKTRCVEKFWLLANAPIGSSGVREEQLPDSA